MVNYFRNQRKRINKMSAYDKLKQLGIELTKPATPAANYLPIKKSGNNIYISGQLSTNSNGLIKGTMGKDITLKDGQTAAKFCAISIFSQIVHNANIEIDDIKSFVKLTILVSSTPEFINHHLVANGASDFIVEILGDKGKHARAAFGVSALPLGAAVEIEAIIEV